MRVLATRKLRGPAWDELGAIEVGRLDEGRDDVGILNTRGPDEVLGRRRRAS